MVGPRPRFQIEVDAQPKHSDKRRDQVCVLPRRNVDSPDTLGPALQLHQNRGQFYDFGPGAEKREDTLAVLDHRRASDSTGQASRLLMRLLALFLCDYGCLGSPTPEDRARRSKVCGET